MSDGVIELKNLTIGYGERHVLSDVNATIKTGEIVGIIGRNGAGKSTLLKTIRGILPKHSGEVLFFNKKLEDYHEKELACKVAYLQQHVEVGFGYTGQDIVLAGRYPYMKWYESESEADKQLALDCMDYTGTLELADTPVTEVSGGQKQRILFGKGSGATDTHLIFRRTYYRSRYGVSGRNFSFCQGACANGQDHSDGSART